MRLIDNVVSLQVVLYGTLRQAIVVSPFFLEIAERSGRRCGRRGGSKTRRKV